MTDQITIGIEVPDAIWLTSNGRYHWAAKARATQALRLLGKSAWTEAGMPKFERAHIAAFIQTRGTRFDPNNAWSTLKALIDGMVDGGNGLLPDDDHTHLTGPDMRKEPGKAPKGIRRIRLVIDSQEVPW